MSQEQPHRPEAVKYGDVFQVSGELASKPIAPQDAAIVQSAENVVIGQTPKGGPAAVVGQRYGVPAASPPPPASAQDPDAITIGEALEATALSAGDKPIDASDAAAIQAAETRATGLGHVVPGGIAAEAQAAAARNVLTTKDEEKTKLSDVLNDATDKLVSDKAVTREDAEGIISAEIRNKPDLTTHPGTTPPKACTTTRRARTTGQVRLKVYIVLGKTQKSGPASVMQSAADVNVSHGILSRDDVTEAVSQGGVSRRSSYTGCRDPSNQLVPGGVAAQAQSAATHNARTPAEDKKMKLRDVLAGASCKLPDDKAVTKEDAEGVVGAEIRNKADMTTYPGGVAASVAAAASLNQHQQ
ncbi:hypothetical protein ACJIZ3_016770 [Penstemon smallii]|uniref:SMP domain-containing protein n=1 Tax=Penstemon smallii TaxID=265156 RepID=A0ABD3SUR5_9LAMI